MTFTLSPVDLSQEWDSFFACEWAAWTNPPQAIWELTYPILDTGPTAEASAVKNAAARQKQDVHADPLSRWMKIVDSDSGKIVAGALWRFYDTNPYRGPVKKSDATWLPKGELRDLCDEMHAQNRVWRPRIMPVAHAHLVNLFTHPDYRNQGHGGRLVEWGLLEADRRGYEAYVEGTYLGRRVYERYGFVVMHIAEMRFEKAPSRGEEWVRLVKELEGVPIAVMWRPAGGKYVKGETVVPWEGAPRKD